MSIDLTQYGINDVKEIVYNPSYELLYEEEMKPELTGYDKGTLTELDAVNVMTGVYTGRSPKDKYIVMDENSKDTVWWTSDDYKNDNHPMDQKTWETVKELAKKELSGKRLFVRCQQGYSYGSSFHYGSCMAGTFRKEYVHPAFRG